MRLRYTGPQPTTLMALGIEIAPGDEFDAPDDTATAYTAPAYTRLDNTEPAAAPTPRKRSAKTTADPSTDPAGVAPDPTMNEEADGGIPDDH